MQNLLEKQQQLYNDIITAIDKAIENGIDFSNPVTIGRVNKQNEILVSVEVKKSGEKSKVRIEEDRIFGEVIRHSPIPNIDFTDMRNNLPNIAFK